MIGHPRGSTRLPRRAGIAAVAGLMAAGAAACLNVPAALTQLVEARQLASELHLAFTRTNEASNRAVMAADDAAAGTAADEALESQAAAEAQVEALRALLQSLGYRPDLDLLNAFATEFGKYRRLSDEVRALVVESSNVKAQRLSFGPAAEAAHAFRTALDDVVKDTGTASACCAREQALRAYAAVLEIRALHARHIAEADDAEMTRMEAAMTASASAARAAVEQLGRTVPAAGLAPARDSLQRFMDTNSAIVALSRRNSNVRAQALSLGRKRTVAAECDVRLRALEEALTRHEFTATR